MAGPHDALFGSSGESKCNTVPFPGARMNAGAFRDPNPPLGYGARILATLLKPA